MIVKKYSIFFLSFYLQIVWCCHLKNGITYELTKGRLGDQLIVYAQTLWHALDNDLIFFYKPFKGSNNFKLHSEHYHWFDSISLEYTIERINNETIFKSTCDNNKPILYVNSLNTKKAPLNNLDRLAVVALQNPWFKKIIQKVFTPIIPNNTIDFIQDCLTIAVHVRTGSYTDKPCIGRQFFNTIDSFNQPETLIDKSNLSILSSDQRYPNKFPPYQFYIDQINLLIKLLNNESLCFYIFTDHKNPQEILDIFSEKINPHSNNIIMFRLLNTTTSTVEEDFLAMSECDCLIRGGSNLSRAAQLLGNHQITIHIKKARWHNDTVVPDGIGIVVYNRATQEVKEFNLLTSDNNNKEKINKIRNDITNFLNTDDIFSFFLKKNK